MNRRTAILSLLILTAGCGVQQIQSTNRHLMFKLRSALSSKKPDWLDEVIRQIDEHQFKGDLSAAEYAAFQPIIKQARAGNWTAAQRAAFALCDGQKPTADDRERLRKREVQ
ncbi:MAG: hypothetical protein JSS49_21885 [Planctomycetes bacterium]|nr:hypothetical protein [Planctomycetota bacterium]